MPKDSRARTRAARERMAATGETYTQAVAGLSGPPRMNRDTPPDPMMTALMYGELMAAGRRAAVNGPGDLGEAVTAVRSAIIPLWPRVAPEAVRDVLLSCAELAVARNVTSVPGDLDVSRAASLIAGNMLELTAGQAAGGQAPDPGRRFTPPSAYASSSAFDRDEDAAVLDAVCLLLALAHPAEDAGAEPEWDEEDRFCPECGGDSGVDPKGTYGCECFNPSACSECGDPDSNCDCRMF